MKQRFTLLLAAVLLSGAIANHAFGQILLHEGFEGAIFPPNFAPGNNWSITNTTYTFASCSPAWVQATSNVSLCFGSTPHPAAHTGSYMAGYDAEDIEFFALPQPTCQLNTPQINFATATGSYVVDFWVYETNSSFGQSLLRVYLTQNVNVLPAPIAAIPVVSSGVTSGWREYTISSNVALPGQYYYVFEALSGWDSDFFLDDITVTHFIPCNGNPNSIISGPSHVCQGIPFSLEDSSTAGLSGVTYQWQSRLAGSSNPFTSITGATASVYNTTGIGLSTDFRVISQCGAGPAKDTSAIHTVTTDSFYLCYCGPATGQSLNTGISSVGHNDSVGIYGTTLQNPTYTPNPFPNGYVSFPGTGNTTATLTAGGTYRLESLLSSIGVTGAAWIDFDHQNGFGNNANEYIGMTGGTSSPLLNGTFTVPFTATLGTTGLRVRTAQSNVSFSQTDACTQEPNGETEDYLVNITPAPYNDLGVTAFIQPLSGDVACANTNLNVRVNIANMGSLAQGPNTFAVYVTYTGPNNSSGSIYTYYTSVLQPFTNDIVNVGTISLPLAGNYSFTAYTTLPGDQNHFNDTAFMSPVNITEVPLPPVVISDTVCLGNPATIGVVPSAGNQYNWYSAPAGGTVVYTGTSKTIPSLINSMYYFISASTPSTPGTIPAGAAVVTGGQKSAGGLYFDIVPSANTNLNLDSFHLRFADTGNQLVNIYYRISQVAGNPIATTSTYLTSPAQWTLMASSLVHVTDVSATTTSLYSVLLANSFPIVYGNNIVYSIYLDYDAEVTGGAAITNPALGNPITGGDFYYGCGLAGSFSGPTALTALKKLNGEVFYHIGGSACESQRIPVSAQIGPRPIVNLPPSGYICWKPQLFLDAGNPGSQYIWKEDSANSAITIATTQTLSISLSDTGVHKYVVIVDRYCHDTDSTTLTIVPPPFATGINYTQAGSVYYFSVSGARDVSSYYWTFGDGQTSTLASPVHDYGDENNHNIRLVVYNVCGSDTLNWSVPTLLVPNIAGNDNALQLYPNPANNMVTISGNDNMEIKDVSVMNSIGQVVVRSVGNKTKTDNIDISRLAPGHYILRANTSDGFYNKLFEVLR